MFAGAHESSNNPFIFLIGKRSRLKAGAVALGVLAPSPAFSENLSDEQVKHELVLLDAQPLRAKLNVLLTKVILEGAKRAGVNAAPPEKYMKLEADLNGITIPDRLLTQEEFNVYQAQLDRLQRAFSRLQRNPRGPTGTMVREEENV